MLSQDQFISNHNSISSLNSPLPCNIYSQVLEIRTWGLPRWLSGKSPPANAGDTGDGFDHWVGKIPWRKVWEPSPVFLPGQSHGQRSLAGHSPCGRKESVDQKEIQPRSAANICAHAFPSQSQPFVLQIWSHSEDVERGATGHTPPHLKWNLHTVEPEMKQDGSWWFHGLHESEVTQLCPTLCNPMVCSLPGSSLHGILQARTLECVAIPSSRGSSRPSDRNSLLCLLPCQVDS